LTDKQPSKDDPVNMVKLLARNVLDGIFDDLMENNVLNTEELRSLGKGVNFLVNNAENLVDNITEKAQMAGKILKDRLLNPPKQLSLDISSDGEREPNTPDLLENLGYSVVIKENLTAQEMETALRQFAARPEHQTSDSTFLVFMSHGILNGICGTKHWDQEPDVLHDDTIFEIFNNRNCRSLKDKPKVIIMQACRGNGAGIVWFTIDSGKASADTHGRLLQGNICNDAVTKAHVEKDFIAFKSSTPHNVSWRHEINGSVFISQIIYYFKEYSWSHHLEEIFRKVQHSFENPSILTQLPTIERLSMTRYFYLFPGN
uniref:Uncharacterized protein n=1 Tax=Pongo abelii TaxID=9601 RepID=H2NF43_PONAB